MICISNPLFGGDWLIVARLIAEQRKDSRKFCSSFYCRNIKALYELTADIE